MAIKRNDIHPGDRVSLDHYVCHLPGRLPHTAGKEKVENKYNGGTVFVDHASGYMSIHHQVSLRAGETIVGKHKFENFAAEFGIKIKGYHADNMPFTAKEFIDDIELQQQQLSLSGVGAHHQNGVAERGLKTICLLYTSPSPRDQRGSRMPSSA